MLERIYEAIFVRRGHICPWWACYSFDNPLRRLLHDPNAILAPYVGAGDTAIDIGPGMGYFTITMCRLTGESGQVIAVDIQEKMLAVLRKRAKRAGVDGNLRTCVTEPSGFDLHIQADFILAFWMMHEVPDQERFIGDVKKHLKEGAAWLISEPSVHVSEKMFTKIRDNVMKAGLNIASEPRIGWSRSIVVKK